MEALEQFPETPKLYLMMGQILQQEKNYSEARRYFSNGVGFLVFHFHPFQISAACSKTKFYFGVFFQVKHCPTFIPLWIWLSRLEESQSQIIKARSDLEKARLRNPKNAELWQVPFLI